MSKNSHRISLLTSTIVLVQVLSLQGLAFGQELHLKSRNVYTGVSRSGTFEPRSRPRRFEPVHQIIQFDHLPGTEDLEGLLAEGYRIVGAVPDNAVMVVAPETIVVKRAGVRWLGELEVADKLSVELTAAENGGAILALVEFHSDVAADVQQAVAAAAGVTVLSPAAKLLPNHIAVSAPMDQLRSLAAHDAVAYIFPADPDLFTGNDLMPCEGMLTLAGQIAQYANIVHGWDLDSDHAAHLGYIFGALTPKVPALTVQSEVLRAFNAWSMVANVIFQQATSATAVRTIQVKFASGAHGDSSPFDGVGGILAHTFYPVPVNAESIAGDVHLDADENWHSGSDIDIYSVVLHELGHALGLSHSDKPGDVMYPYYRRGAQLSANDIGAVQQLYGAPGGSPVPVAPVAPVVPVTPVTPVTPVPAPKPAPVLSISMNPIPAPGQAATISIAGTFTGGLAPISLQYQTDKGVTGKVTIGSAQGSSQIWSADGIALVTGANTVTVTAFDSAHQTVSVSATVTRTAAAPTAATSPVTIAITSPAAAVTTAKGATIAVGGTASGGTGITRVTWQTSSGATGTADGTDHWVVSSLPLLSGTNTIIVRAYDARGVTAWASVVVTR